MAGVVSYLGLIFALITYVPVEAGIREKGFWAYPQGLISTGRGMNETVDYLDE